MIVENFFCVETYLWLKMTSSFSVIFNPHKQHAWKEILMSIETDLGATQSVKHAFGVIYANVHYSTPSKLRKSWSYVQWDRGCHGGRCIVWTNKERERFVPTNEERESQELTNHKQADYLTNQ